MSKTLYVRFANRFNVYPHMRLYSQPLGSFASQSLLCFANQLLGRFISQPLVCFAVCAFNSFATRTTAFIIVRFAILSIIFPYLFTYISLVLCPMIQPIGQFAAKEYIKIPHFSNPTRVAAVVRAFGRGCPPYSCKLSQPPCLTLPQNQNQFHSIMQKPVQTPPMSSMSPLFPFSPQKSANPKVNRAKAQSRHSGILFAHANGKLYFEFLKIISVPQNNLPPCCAAGEVRYSEVMRPFRKSHYYSGSLHRIPQSSISLNSLISLNSSK